jgi:hypothetical protein
VCRSTRVGARHGMPLLLLMQLAFIRLARDIIFFI